MTTIHTEILIVNVSHGEKGTFVFSHLLCLQRCDSLGVCVPLGWDCLGVCGFQHFWHMRGWWVLKMEEAPPCTRTTSIFIIHTFLSISTMGSKAWTVMHYRERCKNDFYIISEGMYFENYICKNYKLQSKFYGFLSVI